MSVRTDVINLNVNINGNTAQNQLNDLRKKAGDIALELKSLKKGTQEYIDKSAELKKVNADMGELKKTIGLTALNEKELRAELNKLKALKGSVAPFSQEFKDLQKQIDATERRLYNVKNGVTGLASVFSRVSDSVKQFGVVAAGYLGFQFITSQFRNIISGAGKLTDQLADLRRVAGLTAEEADNLNKALGRIDTRTSVTALRDIATIAGKLGVAKDDIFSFTKAVDQLVVSLGDELGDADQITTQLGKILNVFDGKITGDNITRLGNAFVELANTGAATGGFIADFDQRLSGIAKSAGIGLGALSGLGAGLEEMGARVESSSTAIQKLIVSIAADIPAAAKIAGQSAEEFDKLFKFDPTEAILKYSEGLVKNKESFAAVTASLKDAGEEGARTIETISKLGTGADKLRERIDLGKKAIEENTAITEAFDLKNQTLGATLEKLGKEFYAFVMGSGITTFLKGAVQNTIEFINWLKNLPEFLKENRIAISALVTAFLLYNKQLIISNALWVVQKLAVAGATVAQYAAAAATLAVRTATLAFAAAQAIATGNITRAAAAWKLLSQTFKASPIGVIAAGVVALGIALDNAFSKTSKLQKSQDEFHKRAIENYGDQVNKIEQLKRALEDENVGYEQKKKLYQELIALNPEFAETLRLDAQGHLFGAEAINEYTKSLKRKGELEALQSLSNEKNRDVLSAQADIDMLTPKLKSGNYTAADLIKAGKADEQLKAARDAKKYFDDKLAEIYAQGPGSGELVLPGDTIVGGKKDTSIDQSVAARKKFLEEKIKSLETAYQALNATDKKGQTQNLAQQKKYKDELDALMGNTKSGGAPGKSNNGEYERLKKEAEQFYKDLQKLKQDAENADKSSDEKELQALQEKYNELHAKALDYFKRNAISRGQYNEEEKLLVETFNKELAALQKKQFEGNSAEEYAKSLTATKQYFDEQRDLEGQRYAQGLATKSQYDNELKQLDLDEKAQLVTVAKGYTGTVKKAEDDLYNYKKDLQKATTENEITNSELRKKTAEQEALAKAKLAVIAAPDNKARIAAQKTLIQLQFDQDTEGLDKKSQLYLSKEAELQAALDQIDADARERRIEAMDQFAQQLLSITSSLFTALDNIDQRQLQKDKNINDAKKNNYKRQLDSKLISQKQYDKKVAEADAELAKKKHELDVKAFKRQQALAITGALINGAMAITSTLAARPGLADILTLGVARAIQVGLVVAATAAQVAAIATQQPPQAARGNWFRRGKKHKDGGIPVEIEQNEAVMKADAMTDSNQYTVTGTPAQITSKLNSMHGGVTWAAGAKIIPLRFMERPAQINPNLPRIMAQGGMAGNMQQQAAHENDNEMKDLLRKNNALLEESNEIARQKQERLHAVVSIKEYREKEKQYDNAKRASGMDQ